MQHLLPLKTKPNEARKSITPRTVMLSNNKMRAVFSSFGHIALFDGLLPIVLSDFDMKTENVGIAVTAQTELGIFSPFSLWAVPRGFRGRYEFEKTDMQVRYTAHFSGRRKSFSLTVRFYLAPHASLFSVECSVAGDVKSASFCLSLVPVLKKTVADVYCFFDGTDEKERFFFRERQTRNGKGEPLYFGVFVHGTGIFPLHFGTARGRAVVRSELLSDAAFSLGVSHDPDDLRALLERGRCGFTSYFGWEAVLSLQASVSGFSGGAVTEEMLLTRMTLGKDRFSEEKRNRALRDRTLAELELSSESPLVLGMVALADGEALSCLKELSSLFFYMCIRGVPFALLLLCRGTAVRERVAVALAEMGCGGFSFYAGGLYAVDGTSLDKRTLTAVKALSVARIDLNRGIMMP